MCCQVSPSASFTTKQRPSELHCGHLSRQQRNQSNHNVSEKYVTCNILVFNINDSPYTNIPYAIASIPSGYISSLARFPTVDLTTLNPEQLQAVKQQFDQELNHFTQSLQALIVAKNKFSECVNDIKTISSDENKDQRLLIPASASLYIPGQIKDNRKFMVDVGTGYYVEKDAKDAIAFYEKKIEKLDRESVQIQNIIKDKTQSSMAIESQIRQAAIKQHEASKKNVPAA